MADGNATDNLKIPTGQELFEFFREFLSKWSGLAAHKVEVDDDGVPPLDLELGLMFNEPLTGILVIRASEKLEKLLEESSSSVKARETKLGFFTEVVILFWNRFVAKFWALDSRKLAQALFKKSIPLDWPTRRPDRAITVFIKEELLEIRLWTSLSQAEMENWKKSRK